MQHFRMLSLFLLVLLQGCSAQSNLIEGEEETITKETLRYYLYYPEGYEEHQNEKFALLLFLHGGG